MQEDFVVGVDLGTSGVRAIVFDRSLRGVAQASRSYGVNYAPGGVAEQPVAEIMAASDECIREVARLAGIGSRIRALAFCSTASSLAAFRQTAGAGRAAFVPATPVLAVGR